MITAHLPTESGVYCIKNNFNNKIYIGFSTNIKRKLHDHCWRLRNNIHHNTELQKDWNLNSLCWQSYVLELTLDTKNEEKWIIEFNSQLVGYNISIGRKLSNNTKIKISNTLKGRISPTKGKSRSKQAIIQTAIKNKGLKRSSSFCKLMSLKRNLVVKKKRRSNILLSLTSNSNSYLLNELKDLNELIFYLEIELFDFETNYYLRKEI